MDLSRFPRRRYTPFVTPLEPLPRFSAALAATCPGGQGPEVWIKRDDMLGLFPGGNKTRKLEFLVADALAQGSDHLVTTGAPQSNHCRQTAAAAARSTIPAIWATESSTVILRLRPLWVALTLSTTSSSSAPASMAPSAPRRLGTNAR